MSKDVVENPELYESLCKILEPVMKYAAGMIYSFDDWILLDI
jgi:hypothetical protein